MSATEAQPNACPIVNVMGLPLSAVDTDGLIRLLLDRAEAGISSRVCYVNANSWNLARRDLYFHRVLASADILYADGMSVVWASHVLGPPLPARLSAADYIEDFARASAARQVSLYLLGGREGVAEIAARRLAATAPGLNIVGTGDGYFAPTESPRVIDRINQASPQVLLVGMGSPRQEFWVTAHQKSLNVPVVWTVGALFDYLADAEARAPQWMCRAGLEWLFRLAVDPRGKASRYLLGNPAFAGAVLVARLNQVVRGRQPRQDRALAG